MARPNLCTIVAWIGVLLVVALPAYADDPGLASCGTQIVPTMPALTTQTGGNHITASGVLRVLIVFASFPDDSTPHPYWPQHSPPLHMSQFIDPDTATKSQSPFNLTAYFSQMSLGRFHVVGDAVWVEMTESQDLYRNGSYGRANYNALVSCADQVVDFSKYDHWTNSGSYANVETSDGIVDMIIMVWRTTLFGMLGEASLGYKPGFALDGVRIEMGFPERGDFPLGSGVTCEYPYTDDPVKVMRTMAHEFSHWLLGGPHPYNSAVLSGKHQFWGVLCPGQRLSSCMNSYERERLGWISVPDIPRDSTVALSDFLETGAAFRYHPPNGDPMEYFYIENHQKLSVFDDVTSNPEDRGVWILHQDGPYEEMDNLRIRPSDGTWNWDNVGVTTECFSQGLPLFERGTPALRTGESHRDQIPTATSLVNWLLAYKDPAGGVYCGAFLGGQMFTGSFDTGSSCVFSPYSNPGTATWAGLPTAFSLEIVGDSCGVALVRSPSDPLAVPPARRYLGVDPTGQSGLPGAIELAWGTQWPDGQPLEPTVTWSEIERRVGSGGAWELLYGGPATSCTDQTVAYDSNGTTPVYFRVRVRDVQSRYSAWSNVFVAAATVPEGVALQTGSRGSVPVSFGLDANYPNPFNPTTVVSYQLPVASTVRIIVYDILGREVKVLVNEFKPAGTYSIRFDASSLASGTYLYRLIAGGYTETRSMILTK